MFDAFSIYGAVQMEIDRQKIDAEHDARMCEILGDKQYQAHIAQKQRHKAEMEKEATIERRHCEMCDAIRSTSFWRL